MTAQMTLYNGLLLRLLAQRLLAGGVGRSDDLFDVIRDTGGLQAQDLPSALLSIRTRSRGLAQELVEQVRSTRPAAFAGKGIAWIWCMRGTLHLVTADDARWLIPFLGKDLIRGDRRRFESLGWEDTGYQKGIDLLQKGLASQKSLTRQEISRLFAENRLPNTGQAPVHFLFRAVMEGILCSSADRGNKPAYSLFEYWLGKPLPLAREEALHRLTLRYLSAYGPAAPEDLAFWSGITIGAAREAWKLVADDLVELQIDDQPAWILKDRMKWLDRVEDNIHFVHLLPRYDTLWMGYAKRNPWVENQHARRILPGGGQINAIVLVDGQAKGTWKTRKKGSGIAIDIEPFDAFPDWADEMIEEEVIDIGRFLGRKTAVGTIR